MEIRLLIPDSSFRTYVDIIDALSVIAMLQQNRLSPAVSYGAANLSSYLPAGVF